MKYGLAMLRAGILMTAVGFLLMVFMAGIAFGQNNGALLPALPPTFFNASGTVAASAKLCTTASGGNTNLATYSDASLSTALPNPITLSSLGRPTTNGSTETNVYLQAAAYRIRLFASGTGNTCNGTAVGTLLWTRDSVYDLASLFREDFNPKIIDNVVFCAQYSGATAGAKMAAAIAVLPSTGGTVDCRGLEGAQSVTQDVFSGVTKPVKLLLGGATFSATVVQSCPTGLTIEGIGPASIWKNADASAMTDINLFTCTSVNNVAFRNFRLQGSNKNLSLSYGAGGAGIVTNGASYVRIQNMKIDSMTSNGVLFIDTTYSWLEDSEISAGNGTNFMEDVNVYSTAGNSSEHITIARNQLISTNGAGVIVTGATTGQSRHVKIVGNTVRNKTHQGISLYATSTGVSTIYAEISGNTVMDTNWSGIYLNEGASNVTVANNIVINSALSPNGSLPNGGITGAATAPAFPTNVTITGNVISDLNGYSGIRFERASNFTITGNTIQGTGTAASALNGGIILQDTKQSSVIGNIVLLTGVEGPGIKAQASVAGTRFSSVTISNNSVYAPTVGIWAVDADNIAIEGNTITAAATRGITLDDSSYSVVDGNKIYDTAAAGYDIQLSRSTGNSDSVIVSNNAVSGTHATGKGIILDHANVRYAQVHGNNLAGLTALGVTDKLDNSGTTTAFRNNRITTAAMSGSVTLDADASTTVANTNILAASLITLIPVNAAAGTLISGANSPFVTAITTGSFDINTAGGGAAAGTETFFYVIQ